MTPPAGQFRHPGKPTAFERALSLAKVAWAPVLELLGKEIRFEELDTKPYTFLEPWPLAKELLDKRLNGEADLEKVHWLTSDEVSRVHDEMIASFGGEAGIRDSSAVAGALDRARFSKVAGVDAAPTIIHKAATIMHQILVYHPFVDGQKRTGISCAFIFLGLNGYFMWSRDVFDEVHFAVRVAKGEYEVPEISRWLASRVIPIGALQPGSLPKEWLTPARPRTRQCSVCKTSMRLNDYEIQCKKCGTRYIVVINACVFNRQKGRTRVVVDPGIRMLGD
jgi:death-on-curing protein